MLTRLRKSINQPSDCGLKCDIFTQIFIPAGKTGKMQPLDVGVNRPFKAFWEEEYHIWRNKLTEKDVTKSGYLRGPTRQELIDMVSYCWMKVTSACVQNSFVKAGILSMEDITHV